MRPHTKVKDSTVNDSENTLAEGSARCPFPLELLPFANHVLQRRFGLNKSLAELDHGIFFRDMMEAQAANKTACSSPNLPGCTCPVESLRVKLF